MSDPHSIRATVDGQEVTVELVAIDPELAEIYLDTMPDNRTLKQKKVAGMVRAMNEGDFPFCADPIRLTKDETGADVLADGEHRLRAIMQSGTTQTMLVVGGLDIRSRLYFDQVTPRSGADQLKMVASAKVREGSGDERQTKDTQLRSGIVNLLIRWEADDLVRNALKPTVPEVIQYSELHAVEIQAAVDATKLMRLRAGVGTSATGAVFVKAFRVAPQLAIDWWTQLATGADLQEGSPALTLRTALQRRQVKERWTANEQVYAYARFWNLMRSGKTVGKLQFPENLVPSHFHVY